MGRLFGFIYGIAAYFIFFGSFLYTIGFIGNIVVPRGIDGGAEGPVVMAVIVNLVVLSVFAIQHSVMARPGFKRVWTKIIPQAVERSTYVLMSSLALVLILVFWQPITPVIWDQSGTTLGYVLLTVHWVGWLIVLTSTFMINHFDLFGLKQVYVNLKKTDFRETGFRKVLFYRLVRHPIMAGFLIAFWATPTMTAGHLLFTVVMSAYIYIAVKHFEEKDLVDAIGDEYVAYQEEVGPFFPGIGKSAPRSRQLEARKSA
ncbi:MAG: methanethiol S-methyltransferase [Pikeienuella sp.]